MILKTMSHKSTGGSKPLVSYLFRYMLSQDVEQGHKVLLKEDTGTVIIKHNIRARDLAGVVREFNTNENFRLVKRKDSVKLFHQVISFSPLDSKHITKRLLKDMAKHYIQLRGTDNLYVGTVHHFNPGSDEQKHVHIHLAVSGVRTNGRSSRITKAQHNSINRAMQEYQIKKYPALKYSLPEFGSRQSQQSRTQAKEAAKKNRQSHKEQLCTALEKIYSQSTSRKHFYELVAAEGFSLYERNHRVQGILYNGKKFRLERLGYTDQTFDQVAHPQEEIPSETPALAELDRLRKGAQQDQAQSPPAETPEPLVYTDSEEPDKQALAALKAIRNRAKEQEQGMAVTAESIPDETASTTPLRKEKFISVEQTME